MVELGHKLKEARKNNGVQISEVADDLKMRESQIENIEEGNIKAFKDVFYLKYFIREYSKYLGLDQEKMVDELNEFLFDYTSKIPTDEIDKANKKAEKEKEPKKIISPYTLEEKKKFKLPPKIIYIIIGVLGIAIIYILVSMYGTDDFKEEANIYNEEVIV